VTRKYRHLSGKNKISKFPQVGKMSTDSNILHTSVGETVDSAALQRIYLFYLFRNSQLSTLYSTVKSRTEITIALITTVRYQGNALTDTFNQCRQGTVLSIGSYK